MAKLPWLCRLAAPAFLSFGFAAGSAAAKQVSPAPLAETNSTSIEYPTVKAVFEALQSKPGVVFKRENGWDIGVDEASRTIWSFSPQGYPAYPAVVKRQVFPDGAGSKVTMSIQCEASKTACDELVRTFVRINDGMRPALRAL